jgi:hypothetical protein
MGPVTGKLRLSAMQVPTGQRDGLLNIPENVYFQEFNRERIYITVAYQNDP